LPLCLLLIIIQAALLVSLAWRTGVTIDEPAHLLSAYRYWQGRDDLKPGDMPPLIKIVGGWTALAAGLPLPPPEHAVWRSGHEWSISLETMLRMNAAQIQTTFFRARLPLILFPLGLTLLLWWWLRGTLGPWPALAGAALCALEPTLLAHGCLFKNDAAASFALLLFSWRAWHWWREPLPRNAAWLGGAALLGVLAKMSLLILPPLGLLLVCVRAPRAGRSWGLYAGIAWLGAALAWQLEFSSVAPLVPARLWEGAWALVQSNSGHRAVYLLGDVLPGADPYYFVVALAVKLASTNAVLTGAGIGWLLYALIRRRADSAVLIPAACGLLYLALASLSNLQLGVRLVLPAFVCLIPAAVRAGQALARIPRAGTALAGVLGLALAAETAWAYPNYIPFFNTLAGGTESGLYYLSDSNVDWGQDVRHLPEAMRRLGIQDLKVALFSTDNIWAYVDRRKVEPVPLPWNEGLTLRRRYRPTPGYYAISAALLSGQAFTEPYQRFFASFWNREPIGKAGESIWIYKVD
jgi:hypothetical protein